MAVNQLQDVIQRWRTAEEFTTEDLKLFLNAGHTCIAEGDSTLLLNFIQDEANRHIVRSMGTGLLPELVKESLRKDRSPLHCQAILHHLAQICSEEDMLNGLLQQVDEADPSRIADTITVLMPLVQSVLLRMNTSKGPGLALALDSLQQQISKLPVPYTQKQEQEDVYGLCRSCTALLTFVQPFVQEVKNQDINSATNFTTSAALQKLYAIMLIQESLPKILFYHTLKEKDDIWLEKEPGHPDESRACVAYLLFVQCIAIEAFPAVFSPVYILQCNMKYVNLLLSRKDESWILKGLDLFVKCLERLTDSRLPVELLDLKTFHEVPQTLIRIMIDCPIQHLRGRSLVVFQLFIEKLNGRAKHAFFRRIVNTSHHAGVESTIIKNIKNQVELSRKFINRDGWFEGTNLLSLLRDTIILPQAHETDLLRGMDRIMESLNLLRYLLIQERRISTGIWTELRHIAESYTKLLRVCLGMSKSFYGTELKRLREEKKIKAKEFKDASGKRPLQKLIVEKEMLCNMSPEAQDKVLQCALVTYDLMESLVVRIEEIVVEA
ncbi:hypothetical protein DNTS_027533 [Danionella cerebrum]|uniref:Glomulin n=1 Tax=Danionella cerebrum TaxID=2873325 RepID=A0A553R2Q2_9TELE|nr:hypothetical protein DNTS_027533 [Danionella translucida]